MLKHPEPYRCDVIGCRRTVRVTTVGDLERHKRSRHWQTNQKSYQCAAKQCRNRDKKWLRLDNFKQHIERMHRDEDTFDLIKRYDILMRFDEYG